MLQWEHSAILSTFIKLQFVIKIFVLSIFEWPFKTGFTVLNRVSFHIKTIVPVRWASTRENLTFLHANNKSEDQPAHPKIFDQCLILYTLSTKYTIEIF